MITGNAISDVDIYSPWLQGMQLVMQIIVTHDTRNAFSDVDICKLVMQIFVTHDYRDCN